MSKRGKIFLSPLLLVAGLLPQLLSVSPLLAESGESGFLTEHRRFFTLLYPEQSDLQLGAVWQPKNKAKEGEGEFDLYDYSLNLEIPVSLNDDFYLRFGGEYEGRNYQFDGISGGAFTSETLHKVALTTGAGIFFADNLLLTGTVRPGVYSDFEGGVDDKDARLFWDAQLVYQINPGTQILGGVSYNEIFDDTSLYPLFGIRLLSEEGTIFASLTFPTDARIGFNVSPEMQLYLGAWTSGDEYHATVESLPGDFDIHVQDRRAGAGIRYWLTEHIGVKGELGYVLKSELEFKTSGPSQFSGDTDSTGYAKVGLNAAF